MILAPIESKLELDFNAYLRASPMELEGFPLGEHELSRFVA